VKSCPRNRVGKKTEKEGGVPKHEGEDSQEKGKKTKLLGKRAEVRRSAGAAIPRHSRVWGRWEV